MKKSILIGMLIFASASMGMTPRVQQSGSGAERWEGFVLRDGLQVPVSLELAQGSVDWTGRFRAGNGSTPLEHVRFTPLGIHFELPGEGDFDGSVAGDWMAGSISGAKEPGTFALRRQRERPLADPSDVRGSGDFAGI